MSYRLTKMKNLQNALISRLFGVFARVHFAQKNSMDSAEASSASFSRKKS